MENLTGVQKQIIDVAVQLVLEGKATPDNALQMASDMAIEHTQKMIQVIEDIKADRPSTFYGASKYRAQYYKMQESVKQFL